MAAATAEAKVEFQMTGTVWSLLGLDDLLGYTTQTYPSYEERGRDRYAMSRGDLVALLLITTERAIDPSWEHTPAECRALRLAAAKMRDALKRAEV